jgi:site-specific DNA recombinase
MGPWPRDDLRRHKAELRKREQTFHAELDLIANQLADRAAFLRPAETLSCFSTRLRATANADESYINGSLLQRYW